MLFCNFILQLYILYSFATAYFRNTFSYENTWVAASEQSKDSNVNGREKYPKRENSYYEDMETSNLNASCITVFTL